MLLLCSCASDVANRYYASEKYPPKKTEAVEVLKINPDRPFIVIADLQARNMSVSGMRAMAAKIGADAVIIQTLGGIYSLSDEWVGKDSNANYYSRITGTAIRYK